MLETFDPGLVAQVMAQQADNQKDQLIQLGGVMVLATPMLVQLAKRWVPKRWRSALPLILGLLGGLTFCLQSGLIPWRMDGLMTVMASMGGSSVSHSLYEIGKAGPRKAKRVKLNEGGGGA